MSRIATSDQRIADLFRVKNRFLRSINLERDFDDPDVLSGYVPTEFTQECFDRMTEGLRPQSGQRAWRMTGDYGSGKSSFALFLAHAFSGYDIKLHDHVRGIVNPQGRGIEKPRFVPVLTTCSRQSVGMSILQSLQRSISRIYKAGIQHRLALEIQNLRNSRREPSDEAIINLILRVNSQLIADHKGNGLLLILDELGKFLEYASMQQQQQDIFLLQRLAEEASRSGKKPLFIVCLLHQGFNAYADQMDQSSQREWEKVAGRYEEIVFNQPIEQITHLIAAALNVDTDGIPGTHVNGLKASMKKAAELGWFGAAPMDRLTDLASSIYPMHPMVLPVLVRAFRRFGQNERSLFSFLLSNEPFGLQAFSERRVDAAECYKLHNLYDYIRVNFGHKLAILSYRSHWNLIDSVIESFATEDELHIKILKTVGILNLLNDPDLVPSEESVICAMTGGHPNLKMQVADGLAILRRTKRVLYDRGRARGLCLWPHTSVDLEKALDEAQRAIETPRRVADVIKGYIQTRPIVARRHYIETGNLRHFEVRYCSTAELAESLADTTIEADGLIIVPLCETGAERKAALEFAKRSELKGLSNWLVAVPQPLNNLAPLLHEVQRWEWITANTLELNADKYAREEVSKQKEAAHAQLDRRLQSFLGFKQLSGQTSLEWYHQAVPLRIKDGRHLLKEMSRILDDAYDQAPKIQNELVNRRLLSSAAAAARMRLIERMFANAGEPLLGMDRDKKPPEMSMYLSVLGRTGLHHEHEGTWHIAQPHYKLDKCGVLPAFRRIREYIQKNPDSRVNVANLFAELRQPPYGIRDGIIPLLLTVFTISHEHDVAFYKDGTFLREMNSETMLLITKAPDRFEMQYCKIEGIRAELFCKMLALLEVTPKEASKAELLDVVKPLCVFVAQLPGYVLNTKKLTPKVIHVRDTILNAREPLKLLFTDLPRACGYEPFLAEDAISKTVQLFIKSLRAALDELRAAYPLLLERLKKSLREALDFPGIFPQFRTSLAERAEQVALGVTEPRLKAFCFRLSDDNLPETEWIESLGTYLAHKPPSKWQDSDEEAFYQELSKIVTRFNHTESIVFANGKPLKHGVGIRLAITQANGTEHEQVVHFTADEEHQVHKLQSEFAALLTRNNRLGLVAASRALWVALEKEGKVKGE